MRKENVYFISALVLFSLFFTLANVATVVSADTRESFPLEGDTVGLFRPLITNGASSPKVEAAAFISSFIEPGREMTLAEHDSGKVVAIASLTKLMTASVILDNYKLSDEVVITKDSLDISSPAIDLALGERFSVENLLHIMLIESNNTAAEAFADKMGRTEFIAKMNAKASEMGMDRTNYINPSGLDVFFDSDERELSGTNTSTPEDLEKLVAYITEHYPIIPQILSLSSDRVKSLSGAEHSVENTNVLLKESSDYLWGKTGYTKEANGCIILILKDFADDSDAYIINVITGADDRFKEARKLESWLASSFIW